MQAVLRSRTLHLFIGAILILAVCSTIVGATPAMAAGNTDIHALETPADVYVDDTWAGTTVGIDPDGSGPATSFGSDAFATIQNGVDAVAPDGTVHVAAGTYSEQVTVAKSLHLLGAGTASSIIQAPGTLPDASQQGSAIIIVSGSGVNAELTGFTVTGPGPSACGSIRAGIFVRSSASLNIHDNTIQDIRDSAFGGCQNGVGILVGRQAWLTSGTATIHHNTIIGYQKGGIVVDNTASDATISDNTVTGAGTTPITAQNGIQVSRGATANLSGNTVTGNSFHLTGNASDWGAAGILLYQPGAVVLSGGNTITGNDQNLYYETGVGGVTLGSETLGASSAPVGTGFDIYNDLSAAINATSVNFAGAGDGFAIEDRVYHQLDDATLGLVTWTANNVYVTTASGRIQRGIDAVASAGTVNVAAATFVENVSITKPLTLAGADEATTILLPAVSNPNCGGAGGGSLCTGASSVILVQANDVTIHDLTVDGDNPALHSGVTAGGADLDARNGIITNHAVGSYDNLEVHHVTVRNIYLRGMYASTLGSFNFHDDVVTNVQADPASIALFAWYGPGVFQNNTVSYANDAISANHSRGIQFLGNTVSHSGSGVHTDNAGETGWIGSPDLIQGNSISDCNTDGYGIFVFVPYLPLTVNNNTITNCTVGLSAWGSAAPVTVQFTNNVVTGPGKTAGSVGAYITTDEIGYGYTDVAVNFSGNTLMNNETGVMLTADQQGWNPYPFVAKTVDATFHTNQIFNNTHGVDKGSSGTLTNDFAHNWWGTNLGPDAPDNTYGTGDSVVAGILYSPWCANAACSAFLPPFGTSTAITSDLPDSSVRGQNVTINFSVANQVTGGPIPAGTVDVSDGSTVICQNVALDAAGSGTCTYAFTSVNSYTLTATFTPTALSLFNSSSDTEEHSVVNGVPVITEGASATVYMSRNGSPDPFDLTLHATDPDAGDTLTWSIISPAAHGSASVSVPNTGASIAIGYTSNLIFGGVDAFVVGVSDGMGGTDRIAVHVFVLPINSAPVITQGPSVLVSMSKNGAPTPFALTLNATDAENDALTWSIATLASSGTASVAALNTGAAMTIGYAPATDFTGSDSFVVQVSDGTDTDNIVVHITVTAANNPPSITEGAATSVNMSVNGKPTPFDLSLHATDVDVTDTMTWSISTVASHGTASVPVAQYRQLHGHRLYPEPQLLWPG